uniref:B30.2/SPRY domain-containing protein n=1 Tax=Oncorhynchus mykiss TaxID=8022 RepID=A0A8C7W3Q0_ONCMY
TWLLYSISCSICLDLLKDPVTTSCGYSYCMGCIEGSWDQDDHKGFYSCPLCMERFIQRPVLKKNTLLKWSVIFVLGENSKLSSPVWWCLASCCESHLKPHYESPTFKKHHLVQATTQLQEKIYSHHDKLLEVYCWSDQQFICYQCLLDEHKGHETVSVAAERIAKQSDLGETFQQRIQGIKKEKNKVRKAIKSLNGSIFTSMICSIEKRHSEVKKLIIGIHVEERLVRLEQEVVELRRRGNELEETEDHIHFLQTKSVSGLKERLEDVLEEEVAKISGNDQLTLDPNTARNKLYLSVGNRDVKWDQCQLLEYPDHPDRFTFYPQVPCREGLSGACYWEVHWDGDGSVCIAVSYQGISRKDRGSLFGKNDQSWCLICSDYSCTFYHNDKQTDIPVPCSSRVGVYLDHKEGTLSFYGVSMTLLHRVQTTFPQHLYPGFGVDLVGSVKIMALTH